MKSYIAEIIVDVDDDEAGEAKEEQIRRALESLDPSVGIITVTTVSEE